MSALDRSTVHHYAKLANLAFSPEQADVMAHELASILEYVNKISELDLSDTEPTFSTFGQGCHTREDRSRKWRTILRRQPTQFSSKAGWRAIATRLGTVSYPEYGG